MSRSVAVPSSYFGKLPSRGDFVRSSKQSALIDVLDQWLSQGIELMSLDPRWKEVYDRGQRANFAFISSGRPDAIAGCLTPSADSSGRRFPFVIAGSFQVDEPLDFLAHSPMVLNRLWAKFEFASQAASVAVEPTAALAELAKSRIDLELSANAYAANLRDFLELRSLSSLEGLLRAAGHAIDLRQAFLALGLLLQPLVTSANWGLKRGLRFALPIDPLYGPLVASCWLKMLVPFLRGVDVEVGLFIPRPARAMAIGFSGGCAAHLHALFDGDAADLAFVDLFPADWVEERVRNDYSLKKLSSYLQQPELSLGRAISTFREAFLGE